MKITKGFTLMELLIVIGVLGILAAGLLAAIDPFEQLRKARDTNNRSATIEMLSGLTRYFASHGAYPWNLAAYKAAGSCSRASAQPLEKLGALGTSVLNLSDPTTGLQTCFTDTLMADGELKSTFFTGVGSTPIYLASDPADNTNVVVCFSPEGKSSRNDASTSWYLDVSGTDPKITDQTGVQAPKCPDVTSSSCLQCYK